MAFFSFLNKGHKNGMGYLFAESASRIGSGRVFKVPPFLRGTSWAPYLDQMIRSHRNCSHLDPEPLSVRFRRGWKNEIIRDTWVRGWHNGRGVERSPKRNHSMRPCSGVSHRNDPLASENLCSCVNSGNVPIVHWFGVLRQGFAALLGTIKSYRCSFR